MPIHSSATFIELHTEQNSVPIWIHIVPSGTFSGRDGRGPFHLKDPQGVIASSLAEGSIPVDYNHAVYQAGSKAAGAAGWIDRMENRANGIWAHVEWTSSAKKAIADREWRFISPAFMSTKTGDITRIDSVGLVNRPNLALLSLNSRQAYNNHDGMNASDIVAGMRKDIVLIRESLNQNMQKQEKHPDERNIDLEIKKNLGLTA
ncbi:hypothetical protein CSR02_00035 [Acetobacter pomorum]|uniref:Uncharacterized protein n=1 Tax=Acetobacter pomorum TaxID=65959 RepID=A0A2G4RG70_9PROT|nr:phage protease [Acetobacter pomorum]PHY95569.1 hypothetical protein CSR02_00035 [Acetobacter pomorum]GBR50054.1 Mu-like prophage I protein [Acetobacter pomorum DSM 11825]